MRKWLRLLIVLQLGAAGAGVYVLTTSMVDGPAGGASESASPESTSPPTTTPPRVYDPFTLDELVAPACMGQPLAGAGARALDGSPRRPWWRVDGPLDPTDRFPTRLVDVDTVVCVTVTTVGESELCEYASFFEQRRTSYRSFDARVVISVRDLQTGLEVGHEEYTAPKPACLDEVTVARGQSPPARNGSTWSGVLERTLPLLTR